ncbi:universal stress protein [Kutzneria sp. 744]|uniref:universal stress protein n=1 Tax=Kutzneria sp. (strain 744) TaxID=345341 RepID=UPI0003EEAFA6|nr:universal stress protein [Kutzneria sp. 744]EWM19210.1 universal stress protein [Kutzneria sp. 744]
MATESGPRPIVACVDGSTCARHAVRWATAEAVRRGVPLRLVHTLQPPSVDPRRHPTSIGEYLHGLGLRCVWEAAATVHRTAPTLEVDIQVRLGEPSTELLAESHSARLIVAGARGLGGFSGLRLGSTALALATAAHCPVVIVRKQPLDTGPVVVGVTGSPLSDAALGHAFDQAAARAETLIALHAWHPLPFDVDAAAAMGIGWADVDAEQHHTLARWVSGWQQRYPQVRVTRMIATKRAARSLLDQARIAQLLVVGCHGRSPLTGLVLGAAPRALLHQAACPVMVVRAGHGG